MLPLRTTVVAILQKKKRNCKLSKELVKNISKKVHINSNETVHTSLRNLRFDLGWI